MTRIAVVGLGTMGRNHVRVLRDMDGVDLVAVCDREAELVESVSQRYGTLGYTSFVEMFERESLDAVVVAVPTRFHREVGVAALEHGLHALVEKPIASDLAEGRSLVNAAARHRRILAVGHVERFNPAVRELQGRLADGELGRIFQVQARRVGPFPARIRDVGVVVDLATHDLDVISHLASSSVVRLYAETEQRINTEHEDILNALLKFESGVLGVLQVNWLTPTKIRELSVVGEKGMFVCNYLTQELVHYKNADVLAVAEARSRPRSVREGEAVMFHIPAAEPLRLELESFLCAVRGERQIEVGGESGLRALHLALAVVASATESSVLYQLDLARLWEEGINARRSGNLPHSA